MTAVGVIAAPARGRHRFAWTEFARLSAFLIARGWSVAMMAVVVIVELAPPSPRFARTDSVSSSASPIVRERSVAVTGATVAVVSAKRGSFATLGSAKSCARVTKGARKQVLANVLKRANCESAKRSGPTASSGTNPPVATMATSASMVSVSKAVFQTVTVWNAVTMDVKGVAVNATKALSA